MSSKAIESNQFRIYAAQKFIEGLLQTQLSVNNLYVWLGKTTPWSNESVPDQPNDTDQSRSATYFDMLAMKKVSPSDVILVVPKYDWTAGTVYSQYTYSGVAVSGIYYDLYEPTTALAPFYVITDEYNVYKCLGNNSGGVSSVKPTGTGTTTITTADGYIWKFMFQVSSINQQKFLSSAWIPIYTLKNNDGSFQWAVQTTAIPGAMTPPGGHGSNPVMELGAMYVMVDVEFKYDESGKITVNNDYRKFGILLDPVKYGSLQNYTALIGTMTTNLVLSSVTGVYSPDDTVTGQTSFAIAKVVDYNATTNVIRLIEVNGTFVAGETLLDNTSSATSTVSTITNPDVQPNTGLILTTECISPVTRAATQIEDVKIIIPF